MRRLYRPFVHRCVALSGDLAAYLHQRVGAPQPRISQIYNGVDSQRFAPAGAARSSIAGSPTSPGCPASAQMCRKSCAG